MVSRKGKKQPRYPMQTKIDVLDYMDRTGAGPTEAARQFRVPQSAVTFWKSNAAKIRAKAKGGPVTGTSVVPYNGVAEEEMKRLASQVQRAQGRIAELEGEKRTLKETIRLLIKDSQRD